MTVVGFYLFPSRVSNPVIVGLHLLSVSSSCSPILNRPEMVPQGDFADNCIWVWNQLFMLLHNNFNIYSKVQDKQIHIMNIQPNNTVGAVLFLKTQPSDPWR